jgi:AAA family ATP:ADP antiporter
LAASSTALSDVADRPRLLERSLRLFGDVRGEEASAVLLQLFNLFLLLVAYNILKTVREPLILATGGAAMKSYASAAQAVTLMAFIPLYGWLAARVDRLHLITWVLLFFLACLALFSLGLRVGVPGLGFVFYVWIGIFSLATIAQFWSFANDLYSRPDGERLFPLIGIGATAGSPLGSKIAGELFSRGVNPAQMMMITAALLGIHLVLYRLVNSKLAERAGHRDQAAPLTGPGGFALVFRSRYLRLAAVLLVLLNLVNTTGNYVIDSAVVVAAEAQGHTPGFDKQAFIGSFYGDYYFWANVLAFALQAFLVARLVKLTGLAGVILMLPLVSMSAYALIGAGAAFAITRWAKTAENATDYSVMNMGRQMMWLPTTREEKYKAKQTLDTFFVRAGDVVAAGLVFAGTHWVLLGMRGFAWVNVGLAVAWLVVGLLLLKENRRLVAAQAPLA